MPSKTLLLSVLPFFAAAFLGVQPALAQQTTASDHNGDETLVRAAGVGAQVSSDGGRTHGAAALQALAVSIENHPPADDGGEVKDDGHVYSAGAASFSAGNAGAAIDVKTRVGKNLWERKDGQVVVPLLGFEPLSFAFGTSLGFDSRQGEHSDPHGIAGKQAYFSYMPMASTGIQFFADACKATLLVRGGAALTTLGNEKDPPMAFDPAYGLGAMGVCKDLLLFNAEVTRIKSQHADIDQASFAAALKIPGQNFAIGAVFDGQSIKDAGSSSDFLSLPTSGGPSAELTGRVFIGGTF